MKKAQNKITAVIPTRAGSERVKQKNVRSFSDSTLLNLKINTMKQLKYIGLIEDIVVNSDCPISWEIANKEGVKIHERENYYASSDCPITDYWKYCAENIASNTMLLAQVTSPFVSLDTYKKCIYKYTNSSIDSLNTITKIKEYIWKNNRPYNYNWPDHPKSQNLPKDLFFLNFGVCIISKTSLIKEGNIVTKNNYFYESPINENIDIDSEFDFSLSEHIYNLSKRKIKYPSNFIEQEYFQGHGY